MNNNVLVILGNGYDVAQGFPSRYKDFYDGSTDLKVYANNGNKLCKHIIDTYNSEDTQWSDLEEGLYFFSLQLTKKNGEGNKAVAERFKNEFNELRSALFNYIHAIGQESKLVESQSAVMGLSVEWMTVKPQYLTFNYSTVTLGMASGIDRTFWNADDSINPERFVYQHGSVYNSMKAGVNPSDSIVLGIDEAEQKVEQLHSFPYKSQQKLSNLRMAMELIDHKSLYIIYGCSVGDSDAMYFKRIFSQKHKEYIIYYYNDTALKQIKSNIGKMCGSYTQFEIDNNINYLPISDVVITRNKTNAILHKYI